MKKNYIEESILISVFTIISMYVYQQYRLTYLINEPPFSMELLIFPVMLVVAFILIVSNKKSNDN
ncbi:hypothetical protein [Faecalimicrobium sp. JNUCC 81]